MYSDGNFKVMRDGAQLYASIPVQLDPAGQTEGAYQGGGSPYFAYRAYMMGKYDFRQKDLLVSLSRIDPETGTYFQYRVASEPKYFSYDNHSEMTVEHIQGT